MLRPFKRFCMLAWTSDTRCQPLSFPCLPRRTTLSPLKSTFIGVLSSGILLGIFPLWHFRSSDVINVVKTVKTDLIFMYCAKRTSQLDLVYPNSRKLDSLQIADNGISRLKLRSREFCDILSNDSASEKERERAKAEAKGKNQFHKSISCIPRATYLSEKNAWNLETAVIKMSDFSIYRWPRELNGGRSQSRGSKVDYRVGDDA